jgi:microsomal dipeptidase-like Zn-dependent dipeptidase
MAHSFNVDIHCHPSAKPFMTGGLSGKKKDIFAGYKFVPEAKLLNKLKKVVERYSEVLQRTQSHFDALYKGGVRVAFASITPIEKGFHVMNQRRANILTDFLRDIATRKGSEYLISPKVHNALTGYDVDNLLHTQDDLNDYYEQGLLPEYEYLLSMKDQSRQVGQMRYTIRFPKNYKSLQTYLQDPENLCILLTIEGAHALLKAPTNLDVKRNQLNPHTQDENRLDIEMVKLMEERVEEMKNKWDIAPLFISLNHHFWNGLGGHCLSLNRVVLKLVSQQEGLNSGLTVNGETLIKNLLSRRLGAPILLDIKHMSARCRSEFYDYISTERELRNQQYPIICSHTGLTSKYATLRSMFAIDEEMEQADPDHFLFESSINLSAEDVEKIVDSKGLIGIQLDEKRIAGKETFKRLAKKYASQMWLLEVKIIWANILQAIRFANRPEAWEVMCIGSDYDGIINHLEQYPTSADMQTLRKDMRDFLNKPDDIVEMDFVMRKEEIVRLMFGMTADEICEKVFCSNAMAFLKRNF